MKDAYLNLLERALTGTLYKDPPLDPWSGVLRDETGAVFTPEDQRLRQSVTISPGVYDFTKRDKGHDWPLTAHTMIGLRRLRQLRAACECVLADGIPGDFIETGVWRGGACIMMQAVLTAYYSWAGHNGGRRVFVADSFEGLPPPKADGPNPNDRHHMAAALLAVSVEQVKENFRAYNLLDSNVIFLKGWFVDTLRAADIKQLAVLRLDGDMYESTLDAIMPLYPKVSPGGFIIVDDYFAVAGCKLAIDEYRALNKITEPLVHIDGVGVYWRKGKGYNR